MFECALYSIYIPRNGKMFAPLSFYFFFSLVLGFLIRDVVATYVPQKEICPTSSIVRAASGLSDEEETYSVARKAVADVALKSWLEKTDSGFGTGSLPTVWKIIRRCFMDMKLIEIGCNDY